MAVYKINHKADGWQQPTIHIRAVSLAALTAQVVKRFPDSVVQTDTDRR